MPSPVNIPAGSKETITKARAAREFYQAQISKLKLEREQAKASPAPANGKAADPYHEDMVTPPVPERFFQRAKKHPGGRPPKISLEVAGTIIVAVARGNYIETAALTAGIDKVTLYEWLKKGKRAGHGQYFEFSNALQKALGFAELRDLEVIDHAAQNGQWQASAWKLERKFPKRWGRREMLEHSGPDGVPVQVEQRHTFSLSLLSIDELRQYEALVKAVEQREKEKAGAIEVKAEPAGLLSEAGGFGQRE